MTYSRSCGVSLAACGAIECRCGKSPTGDVIGPQKPVQRVILCGNTCHDNPIQRTYDESRADV